MDLIAWNGTSGGWLGFDTDRELCRRITQCTGIPATTSMLAQLEAFSERNLKRLHLLTPYVPEINRLLIAEYVKHGVEIVNHHGLAQTVNRSISRVPLGRLFREK